MAKEYLIIKIGYLTQSNHQDVPASDPVLILDGCMEEKHRFDEHAKTVKVKLSDGTSLVFSRSPETKSWHLSHNKKMADAPKQYSVIRNSEPDSSDEILLKYKISNAHIYTVEDGLKMYGDPILIKTEQEVYDNLVKYLGDHGFICVDEIKRDLKLIVTRNYKTNI